MSCAIKTMRAEAFLDKRFQALAGRDGVGCNEAWVISQVCWHFFNSSNISTDTVHRAAVVENEYSTSFQNTIGPACGYEGYFLT